MSVFIFVSNPIRFRVNSYNANNMFTQWKEFTEEVEDDEEESDENDITADNWLESNEDALPAGETTPQFTWHGDEDVATYSTCCGEPYYSSHTPDHPIYSAILPLLDNHLTLQRTPNMMFDDYIWTTWKSYQPGNPQYSVTVKFNEPIVFRELRLVPNPIPFGVWWYNKELQGICVFVDDVKVDCTPDDFSLPAEPEEYNYHKNQLAYKRDHNKWEEMRQKYFYSFKTSGLTGSTIKLMTKVGSEASYGDLKIMYDATSKSDLAGKYSPQHRLIQDEPDH